MDGKTILYSVITLLFLVSIGISICFYLGDKPDNQNLFPNSTNQATDGGAVLAPPANGGVPSAPPYAARI
ncbi:hypothetical protein H5410_055206 [Solanum commersonii]|uniref:Uncharacterized protein n=1 Tax=Solanum commersonii TaxID=4109 RepID=A0A9J5WJ89_SOLCO|nr:hypothetical protein H5410_055206 [Solanum commersonii]